MNGRKSKWDGVFKRGDKYGKWTIVTGKIQHSNKRKEAQVLAECDCGKKSWIWTLHLYRGNSKSCGCSNHDRSGSNHVQFTGHGVVSGDTLRILRGRAAARGHSVNISAKDLDDKLIEQKFKCALTGLPIHPKNKSASIDRIDSLKEYSSDNIQWVDKRINIMKNGYSQKLFIKLCHMVAKHTIEPDDAALNDKSYQFGVNKAKDIK